MKNFKKAATLSLLAIVFMLGTTSCGKQKVKRDIEGTWKLNSLAHNGVDFYASMGATYTGTWIFNKKAETLTASYILTFPGNPDETGSDVISYKVEDKETIILDGETFHVQTLTDSKLTLTYSENGNVITYNLTK